VLFFIEGFFVFVDELEVIDYVFYCLLDDFLPFSFGILFGLAGAEGLEFGAVEVLSF
jgi:hypothetical protein